MKYRFAQERQDYSDYSSGRVFYGLPGHPAFPVRLVSEIFQRCVAFREAQGATGPCVLYDPCCGGAYHLSTLGYLHWNAIGEIIGSDVDEEVLSVAGRNLSLLTVEGLDRRMAEISRMLMQYKKASHAAALESAERLRQRLVGLVETRQVEVRLFAADATDSRAASENLTGREVDVVISDIPYGRHSSWQIPDASQASLLSPAWQMLEALLPVLSLSSVVAIASDKKQRVSHESYRRLVRFQVGKRRVVLLQPVAE
ncbi:MAG: hypothetical protein MUQ30_20885 [Anaerolineae bacterium]|nr:hypothetical protein [Anaerolineae bacterium]